MEQKFSPCPFCHSENVSLVIDTPTAMAGSIVSYAFVKCKICGARGPSFNDWMREDTYKTSAVEAWNSGR